MAKKKGQRKATGSPELERETILGGLVRMLVQLPIELLDAYERGIDSELEQAEVVIPRANVSAADRRMIDAMLARIILKGSFLSNSYLLAATGMAVEEVEQLEHEGLKSFAVA